MRRSCDQSRSWLHDQPTLRSLAPIAVGCDELEHEYPARIALDEPMFELCLGDFRRFVLAGMEIVFTSLLGGLWPRRASVNRTRAPAFPEFAGPILTFC